LIERTEGSSAATLEPELQAAPGARATGVFRISIGYDGGAYAGWQIQPDAVTIQGELERAAERLNGIPSRVMGAGRTDAGVHARGQAARFETTRELTSERVPAALNAHLPEDIVVWRAVNVDSSFHPIRDAQWKHYRYAIRVASYDDPFDRNYVYRVSDPLNAGVMREAAGLLVGERDFAPFQKAGSPRESTVRNLRRLDVVCEGEYIHIHLVATGFLYGMARNLAGTLLRVGRESLQPGELARGLASLDHAVAGPCLPARGLCLMDVAYAEE